VCSKRVTLGVLFALRGAAAGGLSCVNPRSAGVVRPLAGIPAPPRARADGSPLVFAATGPSAFPPLSRLRGGSSQPALVNNFEEVGNAFVQHFYQVFDSNRANLQGLYQDASMLTFEGEKIMGAAAIAQKLVGLPFQTVKHEVVTVDCQPTGGGGVLVSACGNLKVDGSEHPMKFSQCFCLMPLQTGQGWFCYNDVFRLNYG